MRPTETEVRTFVMYFGGSLRGLSPQRLTPEALDPEITGITQDSRDVPPGSLFVAISGMRTDAS